MDICALIYREVAQFLTFMFQYRFNVVNVIVDEVDANANT